MWCVWGMCVYGGVCIHVVICVHAVLCAHVLLCVLCGSDHDWTWPRLPGGGEAALWSWGVVLGGDLLILCTRAGLVLEGECAGIGHIRPLHGGDGQHRGGRHLHADHQQHREGGLPDHLQLHRLEQLRLRHGDHPAQGARWGGQDCQVHGLRPLPVRAGPQARSSRVLGAQSCLQGAPAKRRGDPCLVQSLVCRGLGSAVCGSPREHRRHVDRCAGKEMPEGSAQARRREPQKGVEGIPEKLGRQSASGALGPEVGCRSCPFSRGLVHGRQDGPGGLGPGSL